ncbi:MAG: hypothetical protein ACREGB_01995 [Candidatus Saccharimonadales bacterium]
MRVHSRAEEIYGGLVREVGELPENCQFATFDVWAGDNLDGRFQLRAAKRAGRLISQDFAVDTSAILMLAYDGQHDVRTVLHVAKNDLRS